MQVSELQPKDSVGTGDASLAVSAAAALAAGFFSAWTVPLQVEEMTSRYGYSVTTSGFAATLQLLVLCVTMWVSAAFITKFRSVRIAQCGTFLAVIGFLGAALSQGSPALFFISFSVVGIGQGLACVGGNAIAALGGSPGRCYNIAYGVSILYGSLALLVIPYITPLIAAADSVFLSCGAGAGVCFITLLFARPKDGRRDRRAIAPKPRFTPAMVVPLASVFMVWLAGTAVWTYSELLGQRIGISVRTVTLALSVAASASIVAPFLVAPIGSRVRLGVPVAIAFLTNTAGILIACTTHGTALFLASFFGQAAGQSAIAGLVFIITVRADPSGRLPSLAGSFNLLGCAIGPFAGSLLVNQPVSMFGIASGFTLACTAVSLVAWGAMAWFERQTRVQPVSAR